MTPPRSQVPKKFLDPSVAAVEKALLRRAEELEKRDQHVHEIPWRQVAAEFRALAEELHHW